MHARTAPFALVAALVAVLTLPACSESATPPPPPEVTQAPDGPPQDVAAGAPGAADGAVAPGPTPEEQAALLTASVNGTLAPGEATLDELMLGIRFVVYGPQGDMQTGGERMIPVEPDGRFHLPVVPSEYILVVRDRQHSIALWQSDTFRVVDGEHRDVGALDMDGRILARTVTVESATGEPLPMVRLRHVTSDPMAVDKPRANPARVLVGMLPPEYHVIAPGHLSGFVVVARADNRTVLQPGILVNVQATGYERIPEGATLFLRFDRMELPKGEMLNIRTEVPLDAAGKGQARLATVGPWVVSLNAGTVTSTGMGYKQNIGHTRFTINALEVEQVIEIEADAERVQTFLDADL